MDSKKRKFLSSILNGKNKVEKSLNEYNTLSKNIKIDIDYQARLEEKYNIFLINLYNYVRAIRDQSKLFEKYNKIDSLLNKTITPKSWKSYSKKYTFFELYNAFRNKNEHPDKINNDEEYTIFKTSLMKDDFFNLYSTCNEVLNVELNKMDENDVANFLLSNIEFKTSFETTIIKMIEVNEQNKTEYPLIYELNVKMIDRFKNIDFDNITIDEIDKVWEEIKIYWKNTEFKLEFINRYGQGLYDKFISICNDDSTIDEYKKEVNKFFQNIYDIEQSKKVCLK